jgi:hypothetical protein
MHLLQWIDILLYHFATFEALRAVGMLSPDVRWQVNLKDRKIVKIDEVLCTVYYFV